MFQCEEKIACMCHCFECSRLFPIIGCRFCVSCALSKLDGVFQVREMESRTVFFLC